MWFLSVASMFILCGFRYKNRDVTTYVPTTATKLRIILVLSQTYLSSLLLRTAIKIFLLCQTPTIFFAVKLSLLKIIDYRGLWIFRELWLKFLTTHFKISPIPNRSTKRSVERAICLRYGSSSLAVLLVNIAIPLMIKSG